MDTANNTQHPAYDLFGLLDVADRLLVRDTCIGHQNNKAKALLGKAPDTPHTAAGQLAVLTELLPQKIAALTALQTNLTQLAAGQNMQEHFAQTEDARRLNLAWKALLDADTETLCTCCSYADNAITNTNLARILFWKLVQNAGITLLSGGGGGGSLAGEYEGSFTFLIGERGLRVEYKRVFDNTSDELKDRFDNKSYTSTVVTGTVNTVQHGGYSSNEFKPSAEPNTDPAAVKAMALEVAAKLLAHYGPKQS